MSEKNHLMTSYLASTVRHCGLCRWCWYVGVKKVGGPFFYPMASQPQRHVIEAAARVRRLPLLEKQSN